MAAVSGTPSKTSRLTNKLRQEQLDSAAFLPLLFFRTVPLFFGSQGTKMIALGALPPSGKGEPPTGVRTPVALLMEKAETSLDALHTYMNLPAPSAVIPRGPLMLPFPPLGNGEPETGVNPPVAESSVKAEMVASAVFGT